MKNFHLDRGMLLAFLAANNLDKGVRFEHRFHPSRLWRLDLAWPEEKLAVEIDGITPAGGRHQRIKGFSNDREKGLAAFALGWTVIHCTTKQFQSGKVFDAIHERKRRRGQKVV